MKYMFFYGTLRRGEGNWKYFISDLVPLRSGVRTKPEFTMWSNGGFPGVGDFGTTAIVGDVFAIPEERVQLLDQLEGHPKFYRRTPVVLEDGSEVEMYLQVLYGKATDMTSDVIADGDWLRHKRERE